MFIRAVHLHSHRCNCPNVCACLSCFCKCGRFMSVIVHKAQQRLRALWVLWWQITWSWSKKTKPGRKPFITAERNTRIWFPSPTARSRCGSRNKQKTPPLLLSGWGCATPALWASGSGSLMRSLDIRTGTPTAKLTSVTCLEPWRQQESRSGSVSLMIISLISSVLNIKSTVNSTNSFLSPQQVHGCALWKGSLEGLWEIYFFIVRFYLT